MVRRKKSKKLRNIILTIISISIILGILVFLQFFNAKEDVAETTFFYCGEIRKYYTIDSSFEESLGKTREYFRNKDIYQIDCVSTYSELTDYLCIAAIDCNLKTTSVSRNDALTVIEFQKRVYRQNNIAYPFNSEVITKTH